MHHKSIIQSRSESCKQFASHDSNHTRQKDSFGADLVSALSEDEVV